MKITITRSYSKKVQLKQFEPIDAFCSAQMEEDTDNIPELGKDGATIAAIMGIWSQDLDKFCRQEVEKTIAQIRAPKEIGKSTQEKKETSKEEAQQDAAHIDTQNTETKVEIN